MEEVLDFLEDEQSSQRTYVQAEKGKRFANYLIDTIAYYILAALVGIAIGFYAVSSGDDSFFTEEVTVASRLFDWVLGAIIVAIYYTLMEYFTKGKSLGKWITKTRAVTIDNRSMSFETVLLRSLCRVVPFEAFSYLGDSKTGWHDDWSKTKVILDEDWRDY